MFFLAAVASNLLWNTYLHYSAFLETIEGVIKKQRSPIEKQIKDYTKIVQWNAHTLFAMKNNVNKTHRTLLKCFKQFKRVLSMESNQYLTEIDKNIPKDMAAQVPTRRDENVPVEVGYVIQ